MRARGCCDSTAAWESLDSRGSIARHEYRSGRAQGPGPTRACVGAGINAAPALCGCIFIRVCRKGDRERSGWSYVVVGRSIRGHFRRARRARTISIHEPVNSLSRVFARFACCDSVGSGAREERLGGSGQRSPPRGHKSAVQDDDYLSPTRCHTCTHASPFP
jgi:hypothetical protein